MDHIPLDNGTREILDWISSYLVSNPKLEKLFAHFAQCEGIELLSDEAQELWGNRMTFNVLRSYESPDILGDWTDPIDGEVDLCSWQILEGQACSMPSDWDTGVGSELFYLCLELRVQSVLQWVPDNPETPVVAELWARAVDRAFQPFSGKDKETRAKNKMLKEKKL